jgi:hypothetical protein
MIFAAGVFLAVPVRDGPLEPRGRIAVQQSQIIAWSGDS